MSALTDQIRRVIASGSDMTIATIRPDGWPQATTVSYAGDGLTIYFGTGAASQKARNLAKNPKVLAMFRVTLSVASVLDYSKGFGHTDVVELGVSAVA
ncbi:MAG: pyridoxamine 5'-phosphate oxidase family protein [Rhizomicrobium sp.]